MSAIKLKDGLWSVGVLNPSLRVFDIVMESQYGTSYNAYLLTGDKNVLIETVHKDYFDELAANIEQIIPLNKLDYLIMNHTEPDHSGSVALLLDRCPNLTVVCSASAKKFLEAISNKTFSCQVAKDGDTLDLGGKTLRFLSAPLLHWPDSMFTWDETGKTLFTCDFLGAHFCEPTMLDSGIHSAYRPAYDAELIHYYNCIFGPFKPSVLAGLDKMPDEATMICSSHGPCLTGSIAAVKARYRQWSTPAPKAGKTAAVLYCSAYGCTAALAQSAVRALEECGFTVTLRDVTFSAAAACAALVNTCDVILTGAPTINRDAPGVMWSILQHVDAINTRGRAAGAFGSFGWSGEAPEMLRTRLAQLKFTVPEDAFRTNFTPTEENLAAMAEYARRVAALVK